MKLKFKIIIIILALFPAKIFASQIKITQEGSDITAQISAIDINRIALINDRIKSIKTSNTAYEFINDEINGDIYVTALPGSGDEVLNIFIISEKGFTYKLLLTSLNIPAEQIFINNPKLTNDKALKEEKIILPYKQKIIDLLGKAYRGEFIENSIVTNFSKPVEVDNKDLKLILKSRITTSEYNIGKYYLVNLSKDILEINIAKFNMKNLRAIKSDYKFLEAGQSAYIYLLRDL